MSKVPSLEVLRSRMERKTNRTETCWLWTGARDGRKLGQSYGRMLVGKSLMNTNRLAYIVHVGPIPDGKQVLHTCDNPLCVNPDHLWLGTHDDNMRDKAEKHRAPPSKLRGSECGGAKLSEQDIPVIRSDHRSLKTIAKDYGVCFQLISQVKNRRIWKHI